MIHKLVSSFDEAVADIPDGAVLHVGGFVSPNHSPSYLIAALARKGAANLTLISTTMSGSTRQVAEYADSVKHLMQLPSDFVGAGLLAELHLVRKAITTFPASAHGQESPFEELLRSGEATVELTGQGTLAERIRAARAGIAAFYTPVGPGTLVAEGKEVRVFNGVPHLLETALPADFALIRAHRADRYGNLVYRGPGTFNATMAGAARVTIAEVDEIVPTGEIDPHHVVTPGVYVQRIVRRPSTPAASWREPH